jgi:hypothetical protein
VSNHRAALLVIACALILDTACGFAFAAAEHISVLLGLYCALANAVTLGGDVSPTNGWGYAVNTAECILIVPLFGATFSLFTSGLTQIHVRGAEKRIKQHLEQRLAEHHKSLAVVPPVRKPKNGSSERMATRAERAASQPTVSDSRQLRDPKGRFM